MKVLTQRERQILLHMRQHEGTEKGELVYEHNLGYVGNRRVTSRIVLRLIQKMALRGDPLNRGSDLERYTISETGKKLLEQDVAKI